MFGFDGDKAFGFDEAVEGGGGDGGGVEGFDLDGLVGAGSGGGDFYGAGGFAGGDFGPIDGDLEALFCFDVALGGAEENPGVAWGGGEIEGGLAAVEDVDRAVLLIEDVEGGERGRGGRVGGGRGHGGWAAATASAAGAEAATATGGGCGSGTAGAGADAG